MGCSRNSKWNKELPPTEDLYLAQRGLVLARTQIHLHTPFSWDACDINKQVCIENLRTALCMNRIDAAFLTDHPLNMAYQTFSDLLLSSPQDQPLLENGQIIANQIQCSNSHHALLSAGFENQVMALGMTQHLETDIEKRIELYTQGTPQGVSQLKNEVNAVVIVPHTESRSLELLQTLGMDGIEIYNIHANVSPAIRHDYLGFDYFKGLIDVITYWIDPYSEQEIDLAFIPFLKVSPIYAAKWGALLAQGIHVTGVGGNDAHQNLLPGSANDGDKIDSYRRMTRWLSNYLLVRDKTLPELKSALRHSRSWVVFEGLGTPVGFDFYSTTPDGVLELGDSASLLQKTPLTFQAQLPSLHPQTPQAGPAPTIILRLIQVRADGSQIEVARSKDSSLTFQALSPGAYRIEVSLIPRHFYPYIAYKRELLDQEYPWIITNPIFVEP